MSGGCGDYNKIFDRGMQRYLWPLFLLFSIVKGLAFYNPTDNKYNMRSSSSAGRVVVVGSANQDLTSYTAVLPRLGETVLGSTFETSCGGKGANQACAAASLDINPVTMICRMGNDVFAQDLLANFRNKGVDIDESRTIVQKQDQNGKPIPTGVASIVVDTTSGDNMIIVTPGANHVMSAEDVEASLQSLPPDPQVAVVLVQLEILPEAALQAMKMGKALGAITILNPAPAPDAGALDAFYPFTDILIPNESELRRICGVDSGANTQDQDSSTELEETLAKQLLLEKGVGKAVIVTLGARGAMVVAKTDQDRCQTTLVCAPPDLPFQGEPVQDTIGAGDAFCGALATYLSAGVPLEAAATMACGFAGMSVRRRGANYPSPAEIPDCLKKID